MLFLVTRSVAGIPGHVPHACSENVMGYGRQVMESLPSHSQLLINDHFHLDILIYLRQQEILREDVALYSSRGGKIVRILDSIPGGDVEAAPALSFQEFVTDCTLSEGPEPGALPNSLFLAGYNWLLEDPFFQKLCRSSCGCSMALHPSSDSIEPPICTAFVNLYEELFLVNRGLVWSVTDKETYFNYLQNSTSGGPLVGSLNKIVSAQQSQKENPSVAPPGETSMKFT
jgi:hypothetical protein